MSEFRFDSLQAFLAMGGHGLYVWVSYGAFFALVVWHWWQPKLERRRIVKLLRARGERHQQSDPADSAQQQGAQQ